MRDCVLTQVLLASVLFTGLGFAQRGPDSVLRGTQQFRKKVLISGLEGPWEVTWGPDNMLWVTERTGKRITRINPTSGEPGVAITISEVSAPGGQDGLLGMALHPELLKGAGNDFVYVAYTYVDEAKGPDPKITDPNDPYRFLYLKIVRLTYDPSKGTLINPVNVITGLPAGNDHVAGRLKIGPDRKLYLTVGDQGHNQLGNVCLAIESQRLPTRKEVSEKDYAAYTGKSLRINLDGSVPMDNPKLGGVISHVFTFGHRNPQGLDFAPDGTLYSSEHGPKTDDEVNILKRGGNYGWPHVAGLKDNKAYEYARWAEARTPCAQLKFNDLAIHPSVPREPESAFRKSIVEPVATMFTVATGFNFQDPVCKGINYICWPTVGASSVEHYQSKDTGIPGWDRVLLVTTLKRGSLYVLPLKANGQAAAGRFSRYFQSNNRFRDTAVSPDGRTIYIATDSGGLAEAVEGGTTTIMQDKGAILAFTYTGEGTGQVTEEPRTVTEARQPGNGAQVAAAGATAPQFTAEQAAAGKTAYNANCAVCHGSTMTNGTFGTPLAGEYFRNKWFGKTVRSLYDRSRKTMPPAAPASLPQDSYARIVAYILETNGLEAGGSELPAGGAALDHMAIR
ncbi:MAG: glucose/sorbosone family PQQ-dependent dehydrogenase [Bryobacteraceae bacterium]|nr:glucose/sorbosone family PQQ-dependent dehydrogenase [Bryobacteraceae bacterium]